MSQSVVHLRKLDSDGWGRYAPAIDRIEQASFTPGSRDSTEAMLEMLEQPGGLGYVALLGGAVAGYCLGAPLERFGHLPGIEGDSHFGAGNTLYAAILAVASEHRGRGIAARLKRAQVIGARAYGYRRLTGRNRCGTADAMWHLNTRLGARALGLVRDAYADGPEPRDCVYYEIDLTTETPVCAPPAGRGADLAAVTA